MTLSDFLLARIAEVEAEVRAATGDAVGAVSIKDDTDTTLMDVDLREMLADLEAKRRIVEDHSGVHECVGPNPVSDLSVEDWRASGYGGPCYTLMHLALPYADHPDYDESWKP